MITRTHWKSKGLSISRSSQHKDMYIITYPDNKFVNLAASEEHMLTTHPPDKAKRV